MNPHRILVIGAGVGGISTARGLLRDGHDVTVFERRPEVSAGGGAVTIWSNGATVLGQLGVDLDGAGQQLSTLRVANPHWSSGRHRGFGGDRATARRTRADDSTSSPS